MPESTVPRAAPATPSSGTGPTPKMSAGAATRLTRTLTTLTWEDGPRVAVGGEAVLHRVADRADREHGDDNREVRRGGAGERRVRAEESNQLLRIRDDGDRDRSGDRERDDARAVDRDPSRARTILAAAGALRDEDLRPDGGDDHRRAQKRLDREAEPDRGDRVLAHPAEPERVDEGVRDVHEVLRDERGRE